jgi:hypothetical protein
MYVRKFSRPEQRRVYQVVAHVHADETLTQEANCAVAVQK